MVRFKDCPLCMRNGTLLTALPVYPQKLDFLSDVSQYLFLFSYVGDQTQGLVLDRYMLYIPNPSVVYWLTWSHWPYSFKKDYQILGKPGRWSCVHRTYPTGGRVGRSTLLPVCPHRVHKWKTWLLTLWEIALVWDMSPQQWQTWWDMLAFQYLVMCTKFIYKQPTFYIRHHLEILGKFSGGCLP